MRGTEPGPVARAVLIAVLTVVVLVGGICGLILVDGRVDVSGYTGDGKITGRNGGFEARPEITIDFDEFDLSKPYAGAFSISNCPHGQYCVGLKIASPKAMRPSDLTGILTLKAVRLDNQVLFEHHCEVGKSRIQKIWRYPPPSFFNGGLECIINISDFNPGKDIRIHAQYEPNGTATGLSGWIALEAQNP